MIGVFECANLVVGSTLAFGTFLSCSRNPHWFVRGWDFPRLHILVLTLSAAFLQLAFFWSGDWFDFVFVALMFSVAGWQSSWVLPFTPLYPKQVCDSEDSTSRLTILVSNILMSNRDYKRWIEMFEEHAPDILLLLEPDQAWVDALRPVTERYPYQVLEPLDNCYGMCLYSKLEIIDSEIRFVMQEDIPSIRANIQLEGSCVLDFYGVHPRPPEPVRSQDSGPRDAELVLLGREIEDSDRPTVVAGDLNDVAWSFYDTAVSQIERTARSPTRKKYF